MADSADTFLGVVVTLAVITAIASGASGGTVPPASIPGTNPTTTTSRVPTISTQSTNIPNGTLFICSGKLISTDTVDAAGGALTLQVYYSPINGGRNCAVVIKSGRAVERSGTLVTTLQFHSYDGRRWPRYATARSSANATRSGGVYLDATDDRCVRASARFVPAGGGKSVTVRSGKVGCG
jgi:hypothetical protein